MFTRRFGSALNSNLDFHALVTNGVFTCPSPFTRAFFQPAQPLEDEDVEEVSPGPRCASAADLAFGFARVHCSRCGRDDLVVFACKGRGFCPSCGARRMADTAAHLVDDVLPRVAVRQWVLCFPHRVRYLLAYDPSLCAAVRRIFVSVVLSWLEKRAEREGVPGARSGAVVFTQRFGSALNSNLHFHALVTDGVFRPPHRAVAPRPSSRPARPRLRPVARPTRPAPSSDADCVPGIGLPTRPAAPLKPSPPPPSTRPQPACEAARRPAHTPHGTPNSA